MVSSVENNYRDEDEVSYQYNGLAYLVRGADILRVPTIAFNCCVLFCALFEFELIGPITGRKLCAIICLVYLLFHHQSVRVLLRRASIKNIILFISLQILCMLIVLINDATYRRIGISSYVEVHYYIWIILYSLTFPLYFATACKSFREFCFLYIAIMLLESLAVFISAVSPEVRSFFYQYFYEGDNRFDNTIYWGTRIIGIYLHSSIGSIILAVACALLILLVMQREVGPIPFFLIYGLIGAATFLVGRTGFLLEIIFLSAFFILEKGFSRKFAMLIGLIIIGLVVGGLVLSSIAPNISKIITTWALELFNPETRTNTLDTLTSMRIPEFSENMILGTNVTLGVLPNGSIMESDSGYAKTYCAIGLVGFILYYISIIVLFRSWIPNQKRRVKSFILLCAAVAFLIEYKEPYFQKYVYTIFYITTIIFLSNSSQSQHGVTKMERRVCNQR